MSAKAENTEKPEYVKEIENAGIDVSPFEARRFRTFLLNANLFADYVQRKLKDEGSDWLSKIVQDGDGMQARLAEGYSQSDALAYARSSLEYSLGLGEGSSLSPESLSKWLLEWPSEKGLTKLRTNTTSQVAAVRRQRRPISCYTDTNKRFMDAMKSSDLNTGDEFLNHLLDLYDRQNFSG